mmetsp:Transcript_27816/g.56336  ORF Transcript_27816/g.56336 Transcript_27816/m.56336 type:complete len:217 (-) Transcript_27816:22-672(-)
MAPQQLCSTSTGAPPQKQARSRRHLVLEFLVDVPHSVAGSNTADLRHVRRHLLDRTDLVTEVLLDLVAELRVVALRSQVVHLLQLAVHKLLELECELEGVEGVGGAVHPRELHLRHCNRLQNHFAATNVLILHELLCVRALLKRLVREEGSKALQPDGVPIKVGKKCVVRIRGSVLHVDMVVERSFAGDVPVDAAAALGFGGVSLRFEHHSVHLLR